MTATPTSSSRSSTDPLALAAKVAARVRQEVVLAHFLGKMAVDRGTHEARRYLTGIVESMAESAAPASEPASVGEPAAPAPAGAGVAVPVGPSADELALADYDHLPAAHIVAKLADLDQQERDAIEAYEEAGRHRRTILGKLALLRTNEPT